MKSLQLRKLTMSGVLIAIGVALSTFSIPIGASKCVPVQHMVNIIGGVLLGPGYACAMAFVTSLIRNLLGTGTLLAFPGSMVGALCCGLLYRWTKTLPLAYLGEVIGTGVLGAMLAYPIAVFLLGKEAALFAYVLPFLVSTVGGSTVALIVLEALRRTTVFASLQRSFSS
jgi:energy coupling factor transporter S component ThiW